MYMVDDVYIVNYSDIMDLINQGYRVLGDLKLALEHRLINETHRNIRLYINNDSKCIDIYANVFIRKEPGFGKPQTFYYFDDKNKVFKMKKQIVLVTKNGEELFGQPYEVDPDSPRPFPDYSDATQQDFKELDKFKEELKIEEIAVERWAVVEVE